MGRSPGFAGSQRYRDLGGPVDGMCLYRSQPTTEVSTSCSVTVTGMGTEYGKREGSMRVTRVTETLLRRCVNVHGTPV